MDYMHEVTMSNHKPITDLTKKSSTFPELSFNPLIPLEPKIRDLQKKFSSQNQRIILRGSSGSGKTVHLAEFVKANPQASFSYFLTDNYWCQRQTSFLSSLCQQMGAIVGGKSFDTALSLNNQNLDAERLRIIFEGLVHKVVEFAKKNNSTFYFVIDGLEWAFEGKAEERIIDLIPLQTNPKYLYFLGSISSSTNKTLEFEYSSEEPTTFSSLEINDYLEKGGLSIPTDFLNKIQKISGGVPGYLYALRKLHLDGVQDIFRAIESPRETEDLLKLQWNAISANIGSDEKLILATLAYSVTPLKTSVISKLTKTDEEYASKFLTASGIVRQSKNDEWVFFPELLRKIAQSKLLDLKTITIEALIAHYKERKNEVDAHTLLSEYYLISNDYSGIETLINPLGISKSISESGNLGGIRRIAEKAKELARHQSNKLGVLYSSLLASQLKSLSNQIIGESEIKALIAMNEFDMALELTYAIKLELLRVRLLGRIYIAKEKKGVTLQRSGLDELKRMIENLDTKNLDPQEVLLTAADIFPILPDTSTALIDKVKGQENSQTAMDLIYTLASIQSSNTTDESIVDKIENQDLQEMALLSSPWLAKLSSNEIIGKAKNVSQTKTKEFLLREWCKQNKSDPHLQEVIEATLDVINSDSNYRISLRNLRQLSDTLRNCNPDDAKRIIGRFDIPNFTSLRSPTDERVRLELNLSEVVMPISTSEAWDRFWAIYNDIKELPLDTDISCYCYTRFLISLVVLDPTNSKNLSGEIKTKLEDEFLRLIDTSADQLDISKRILRALSVVKPDLALDFADLLNTVKRRSDGAREVLVAYMEQDRLEINTTIIDKGLIKITDDSDRSSTLVKMMETGNRTGKLQTPELQAYFLGKIDLISDPTLLCKAITQLIISHDKEHDAQIRIELFAKLTMSWQRIDTVWVQTEAAFDLASRIATVDLELAKQLYQNAVTLRETSALANQTIGTMFFDTLLATVKTVGHIELNRDKEKQVWDDLFQLIDLLPSRLLKCYIVSKIALARLYKKGDKENFDRLIQDHVLSEIQVISPSDFKNRTIANISIALYEYSPEEAFRLVKMLPYNQQNFAWANMAIRVLLQLNIGEGFDEESPNVPIDVQRANKAISIIENIDNDEYFWLASRILANLTALDASHFSEQQRLDILAKLDALVETKLPDINNIGHKGYKVLVKACIESSKRRSAKKSKNLIKKNHSQIIQDAKDINNIADQVLVLSMVAKEFRDIENQIATTLINEAFHSVEKIPNTKDRIDRLEMIAESFSKLNNTSGMEEAIRLGVALSKSLEGVNKDSVLASLIQTAHQLDKTVASDITEKIEDPKMGRELEVNNTAFDLAKSPHKLMTQFEDASYDDEIMKESISKMLKTIVSKKSGSFTDKTIIDWAASGAQLKYDTALNIVEWVSEVALLQCPESARSREASNILGSIIENSKVIYGIGSQILPLIKIPENMKSNFQGLSVSKKLFRVGERNHAISWIKNWLLHNAKSYVSICDPYFDEKQMWILQCVPADVKVKIISSGKAFGFTPTLNDPPEIKKNNRRNAKAKLLASWEKISNQTYPPTFVVIHSSVYEGDKDKFHDRYILTDGGGISIGTSLDGLGNKEFFITVLNLDDVKYVEATYIAPKLSIDRFFSQVIYFELDE